MLTIRYVYRSAKYRGAPMHRCIVTSLVRGHLISHHDLITTVRGHLISHHDLITTVRGHLISHHDLITTVQGHLISHHDLITTVRGHLISHHDLHQYLSNNQGHIEAVTMMMKCQFHWWRKPEYPEETTDL